jgi:PST family polysaccharide transporter
MIKDKTVTSNFLSLILVKGINVLFPLIIVPYIVKHLGSESFGSYTFFQSLTAYFIVLIDFGIEMYGPIAISKYRMSKEQMNVLFSIVAILKLILFVLSILALFLFYFFKKDQFHHSEIALWFIFVLCANAINPLWYFLGKERIRELSIATVFGKIINWILILSFIKGVEQIFMLPLFEGTILFCINLFMFNRIYRNDQLRFIKVKWEQFIFEVKEAAILFSSRVVISIYTISVPFILGLYADAANVGKLAICLKLVELNQAFVNPIQQTFYPYVLRLREKSDLKADVFILKLLALVGIGFAIISSFLFFKGDFVLNKLYHQDNSELFPLLKIIAFVPFFISISGVLGFLFLLTMKKSKAFSMILSLGGMFSLIMSLVFVPIYKETASAYIYLSTEMFIVFMMSFYLLKLKFKKFSTSSVS